MVNMVKGVRSKYGKGWYGESYRHSLAARGYYSSKTKPKTSRFKKSSPKFKEALKTSFQPRELIIPSQKQEQLWAEGLFSFITKKDPDKKKVDEARKKYFLPKQTDFEQTDFEDEYSEYKRSKEELKAQGFEFYGKADDLLVFKHLDEYYISVDDEFGERVIPYANTEQLEVLKEYVRDQENVGPLDEKTEVLRKNIEHQERSLHEFGDLYP